MAPGHIEIEGLPAPARKKLPGYPLPVLRLARLAVAEEARGQGLGTQLLRFVLQLAIRMASDFGCVGAVVDAKPDAVEGRWEFKSRFRDAVDGSTQLAIPWVKHALQYRRPLQPFDRSLDSDHPQHQQVRPRIDPLDA